MTLLRREAIDKMDDPQWLIDGVLPAGAVSMIYGMSNKGKSYCVVDIACCIATGRKWAGRTVQRGPVIYVAGEGKNGYKRRLLAWEKQHNAYAADFHLWPGRVRLWHDPDSLRAFIAEVASAVSQPALVVLDPLSTCLAGADENDNSQMREVMDSAEDICRELHTAVLLIHHTPASGAEKARGAQLLQDAVAMQAYFTSVANPPTIGVLTCKKQRDGERFDAIRRAVHKVNLGLRDACLAFTDEHKTGSRERKPRVTWEQVRDFMTAEGGPVTPSMVSTVFKISPTAAQNQLKRHARSIGDGNYVLPDVDAKVA